MFRCLSILWRNFYPHSNIGLLILYIFVHILHRFHLPLCRVKIKTAKKNHELFLPTFSWDSVPKLGSYLKLSNYTVFFLIVIISKTDSTLKKKKNRIKQTFFNWSVCSLETQQILIYLYLDLSIYLDSLSQGADCLHSEACSLPLSVIFRNHYFFLSHLKKKKYKS